MQQVRRSAGSTVLTKVVMAVTGLILVGFLVTHVASNLTIFSGPEKINEYAAALRKVPALLWGARLVLLASVVLHIWSAMRLARLANASRPVNYVRKKNQASTFASRSMKLTGVLVFAFIIYHLLHFTTGNVHPDFRHGEVAANVIRGFQSPGAAIFYVVAMGAVGLHLAHGVWSVFQTLGVTNPRLQRIRQGLALLLALGIAGGFTLIPLAVLTGFLK